MIVLTYEEFLKATSVDLMQELADSDTDIVTTVNTTLLRWSTILYKEVKKNSIKAIPDESKLKENQVEAIKDALCNLGLYYKIMGDIKAQGCIDDNGNKIKAVPEDLIDDLRHVGLIKKSLGGRAVW